MVGERIRRSPADYGALIESVVLALVIELALKLMPFSRLLGLLNRLGSSPGSATIGPDVPCRRLERFAAAAYRLLPLDATCLRESLVLYGLLRRRGASPRLCLGVRKDGRALSAHAWVECAGHTLVGGGTSFRQLHDPGTLQA
jgi:hypothetical protein